MDNITIDHLINSYNYLCDQEIGKTPHDEYIRLQKTWNLDILVQSLKWILGEQIGRDNLLSIGPFMGFNEIVLADIFTSIHCCDIDNFLIKNNKNNIVFHQTNLDQYDWSLPENLFNFCCMVEVLEHLYWSPVPLLKKISKISKCLIITTPDDAEWAELEISSFSRFQKFDAIPNSFPGSSPNPFPMKHCKQY